MAANLDHLIRLLAAASHADEIAAAPRAWAIIEPHVGLLRWPLVTVPNVGDTLAKAQHAALVGAYRLGSAGQSLSRLGIYEQLGTLAVPAEHSKEVIHSLGQPWYVDDAAAVLGLRESLTRACEKSVSLALTSAQKHVADGSLPLAHAMAQLVELTASIPGQRIELPAPEGRAYREHFARAAKRRLVVTGFAGIDDAIAGLVPGDYVGLAARSNIGKTAFMLALARAQLFPFAAGNYLADRSPMAARLAAHTDTATATDVLLLSLEMTAQGVRERLMLDLLDVNGKTWRGNPDQAIADSALASEIGIDGYLDAFDAAAATLTIIDGAALGGHMTAATVDSAITTWAASRRAVNPEAALLVLVDYWQCVEPPSGDKSTKQQQLGDTSKVLARAAKREQAVIVCAAQIGRAADNHEPNESELRESGDLLIDADLVMLLHAASPAQRAKLAEAGVVVDFKPEAEPAPAKKLRRAAPKPVAQGPDDYALAHDTMLVIGGKGRDVAAGWRVPLCFAREYQRLTDGWPDGDGWRNPFASKEIIALMK